MTHQDEDRDAIEASPSNSSEENGPQPGTETPLRNKRDGLVFDFIRPEELAELARIASTFPLRRASDSGVSGMADAERKDTLQDVELGDPVLDPTSNQFDHYKWARMMLKLMDKEGVPVRKSTGVVWQDLNISGSGSALQYQKNVGSVALAPIRPQDYISCGNRTPQKRILRNFDGVLKSHELLIVLGRPGSGCSTFLKTISGELHGLKLGKSSDVQYNGIPMEKMHKEFKGEVLYNQEVDKHFPHLTVGQTLEFAAAARTPENRLNGISRIRYAKHITQVAMAVLGLSHTYNTKVGDDYIRGVSGGERKRVSIAEMALSGAPVGAWDNSTRGLDSASALEFTKSLRVSADLSGSCHAVAIYQASQAIYDIFNKVIVLYEGRQIFFGPCDQAKDYFLEMGWECPARQTVGDFLTSVTNPQERKARDGMESKVPRTPDDFEKYWKNSPHHAALQKEIGEYREEFPVGGSAGKDFNATKRLRQAKHVRPKSPYVISIPMQVKLCTKRAYQRIWNDKPSTLTTVIGRIVMALIIGSIYFGTPHASAGFQSKGAALFFSVLMNALISITEINSLYDQRPIIEKQASYAFVHPFTESLGGIVADIPVKFAAAIVFNIIFYFLAGLRYEPSQFFIFFLFTFLSTLAMSGVFRTLAASTKTLSQAMSMAGVMVLAIIIYTGFVITVPEMSNIPWFSWIRWINPVFYTFEALVANEFHGRRFECSQFIPGYPSLTGDSFICAVRGAVAGERTVSGDAYIQSQYTYTYAHEWRNLGILIGFWIFFMAIYLLASELNSSTSSKAEFLVFRRGHVPAQLRHLEKGTGGPDSAETDQTEKKQTEKKPQNDKEESAIPAQHDIFTWRNVCYDIPVKGGERRLLDNVSGWVKPGTLTALMGVSGAGKTTLLDVLAKRVSIGVVTGDMLVNGKPLDNSFQRKTGYVQQQDLHLPTTTVREALRFSAMLRQAKTISKKDKYKYVEEVIDMLGMQDFADAIVGTPGEGLNVEQRKLLTIGVELAAKPALLIFLDEPTSGLDSQSSWAICAFLRKLAEHGQAVLSTIHQPSALLFQQFDRLLFLAKGGRTVYFGDIGDQSRVLLDYFEGNGARVCDSSENPAEYMLEIIGAGASGKSTQDWPQVWNQSQQAKGVQAEIDRIHDERASTGISDEEKSQQGEYAMPFTAQLWLVTHRSFQAFWREPSYVWAKIMLGTMSSLFIGFTFFKPDSSLQGFQDVLFSAFMLTSIFSTLVQQIMPKFVVQRSLYEVRERPSKAYSWGAFLIANVIVELPYQVFVGVISWACYYYPIYGSEQASHRQGLMLLFVVQFYIFTSTFASLVISSLPDAETGGTIATLMFIMTLTFNGVMQPPSALPGFWIFMYRASPLTYLIAGITATGLHGRAIQCAAAELSVFNPPAGLTCGAYLDPYVKAAGGQLYNPTATSGCEYCQLQNADQYLSSSNIFYSERWRNFGLGWVYIGFNVAGTVLLYYMFRVKHYNPTSLVRGIGKGASFLCRVFKRRSGQTPKGKEADNGRLV